MHKDSRASVVPNIVPVDHVEEAAKINVALCLGRNKYPMSRSLP